MADDDLLNQVVTQQTVPSNQDVVGAVGQSQWANTFQNTPPAEVLRSRVNLADTINRAFDNKLALQARSDAGALNLMQKNAQFQEYQRQAPLREQLLQAHIDATGATERRKAAEAISQAQDTSGLNSDIAAAYGDGLKPGTDEFQQALFSSLAQHPHANPQHLQQMLKGVGSDGVPVDYENMGAEAKQSKDALVNAGVPESDIVYETYKGHVVAKQRSSPVIDQNQRSLDLANREQIVGAAKTETAVNRAAALQNAPAAQQAALAKQLAHLETLRAGAGAATDKDVKSYMDAEIARVRGQMAPVAPVPIPAAQAAVVAPNTPVVPAASVPIPLDADTARSLLKEAGGDKDKARALAKERGFHF